MEKPFEVNHLPGATTPHQWSLQQAASLLPPPQSRPRSAAVYQHGTLLLKLFAPVASDTQQPHTQDELYFVAQGRGWFVNGQTRQPIQPGDALFVPAGVTHRFEEFSDDLTQWVVFYGPQGGQAAVRSIRET
jgi:mannose-6-phosphate isomerase-like protein (cupin superfamily)